MSGGRKGETPGDLARSESAPHQTTVTLCYHGRTSRDHCWTVARIVVSRHSDEWSTWRVTMSFELPA